MLQYFPNITGSLTVSGDVIVSGSIATTQGITISGSIDSASYSSNSELLDNLDSTAFVFTSSFNTYSSSMSSRVGNIEGNYATTGSNIFMGAQTVCANITSTGTIIAQTLNVQQVTSSVVYSSGSNVFGNLSTDLQQFTGSLRVTGSGNHWFQAGCVGIGTTNPANLLHVSSSLPRIIADTSNRYAVFNLYVNGGEKAAYYWDNTDTITKFESCTGYVFLGCGTTIDSLRINSCGRVGINTDNFTMTGLAGLPLFIRSSSGNSGQTAIVIQDYRKCNRWAINGQNGVDDFTFAIFSTPNNTNDFTRRMSISQTGEICFNCQVCAPSFIGGTVSGTTATFNGNLNLQGAVTRNINFYDSSNTNINAQIQYDQISSNSGQLFFGTNNSGTFATRLTIANNGASTFSAAIAATTLTTNAAAGNWSIRVNGNATAGSSYGLGVYAGTNSSDDAFRVHSYSGTQYMTVRGDGNVGIGVTAPVDSLDVNLALRIRCNTVNFTAVCNSLVIDYVNTTIFGSAPMTRYNSIGCTSVGAGHQFIVGTPTGPINSLILRGDGTACFTCAVQKVGQPYFYAFGIVDGTAANGERTVPFGSICRSRGLHGYCTTNGRMTACYSGVYTFSWTYLYRNATVPGACIDDGFSYNGTLIFGGNRYKVCQLSWGDCYVSVKGSVSLFLNQGEYFEVRTNNSGDTGIQFYGAPTWGYLTGAFLG